MRNGLTNWAFSSLLAYETCPFRIKLSKIDKIKDPPLQPGNPLERGSREHKRIENFIKGDVNALKDAEGKCTAQFLPILKHAQALYKTGQATAEQDWWFDENWNPCSRDDVWLWAKLDTNVTDVNRAIVIPIDDKTGKSTYKVVDHIQQVQLYAGLAALKFEWADTIIPELHYLDEGWIRSMTYTRDEALAFIGRFQARADRMMSDQQFRPNPSNLNCRYCPHNSKGTAACPVSAV
jgi:hypothetical protein